MPKFKSQASDIIRFDYEGKEKVIEPGKTYELDQENDYIQGLIAFGILEAKGTEPETETAQAPEETVKPKK